uniref:Uncharacterized protein n=1 Tax=Anguilla anguilla TaxID=7936 RepID=A0A0E9PIZ2_ANGAN
MQGHRQCTEERMGENGRQGMSSWAVAQQKESHNGGPMTFHASSGAS